MILISHRGNINSKIESAENKPKYIEDALFLEYDVEIDVWVINNVLFLGHDAPKYSITDDWLNNLSKKLWIHCKNIKAVEWFNNSQKFNYFWHQEDTLTLTSLGIIWAYPGKQPIKNSIAVLPEMYNDDINGCMGICSDYIERYKENKV